MNKRIIALCTSLIILFSLVAFIAIADDTHVVNPTNLFEVEGAKVTLREDSVDFQLTGNEARIKVKKPLSASGFSMQWNGVNDKEQKLETVVMFLTDSEDDACNVTLTFGKLNENNTSIKFNKENQSYLTAGSTYKKNHTDINVQFQTSTNTFTDELGAYAIEAETCTNGMIFDGFPSMGVMLELTITGKKGATFCLTNINGQPLGSNYTSDNVEPLLCLQNTNMKVSKGLTCILPSAKAYDVYSEETSLNLTVQDPEGNVVSDTNGKKLEDVDGTKEYEILFDKYGQYRVIYVASDGDNKTRGIGFQINVNDEGAPEIQLKQKLEDIVSVGTRIDFPELIVTDNVEGECITWVNVLYPEGYMICEKDGFVVKTEGIYTITFCAKDANGNIGRFETTIYAKGSEQS